MRARSKAGKGSSPEGGGRTPHADMVRAATFRRSEGPPFGGVGVRKPVGLLQKVWKVLACPVSVGRFPLRLQRR